MTATFPDAVLLEVLLLVPVDSGFNMFIAVVALEEGEDDKSGVCHVLSFFTCNG
jgi:hypothetical protein